MSRYVDAEKMPSGDSWDALDDTEKAAVLSFLIKLPTADVQEVRHGKWIDTKHGGIHGDTIYMCSVCENEREAYIDEENYCPNCGAKMDEEETQ